jgi:phosphopentomutase
MEDAMKRVFLIVLDSLGIGAMPDAAEYGDEGSNTIASVAKSPYFFMPNMRQQGFFNIDGIDCVEKEEKPSGAFARLSESSKGKDTTTGHWEIGGIISGEPMPTFPDGFPDELIDLLSKQTGRKILCNKPYSGTEVIREYGREQERTGGLIVYTSADSVLQIAAHEQVIPLSQLYEYCEIARQLCTGKYGVGRVIARPFVGTYPEYTRTAGRHDYSLFPPSDTFLDILKENGMDVIAVGKINDIFAGKGITEFVRTSNNADGIEKTIGYTKKNFNGICFTNLVDFDMLYGHRNDRDGYAKALAYFDGKYPEILNNLNEEDFLIITADHGCDPDTLSTDHSREYIPLVISGACVKTGVNCHTRATFADIAATILDIFDLPSSLPGISMKKEIIIN